MKPRNRFPADMLDLDMPEAKNDRLFRAGRPTAAATDDGAVVFSVPWIPQTRGMDLGPDETVASKSTEVHIRAYGDEVIRVSTAFDGDLPGDESPMLHLHPLLKPEPLTVRESETGWEALDSRGNTRFIVSTAEKQIKAWEHPNLLPPFGETFEAAVLPDGKTEIAFQAYDSFFPKCQDSVPLGLVERDGRPHRCCYSLHATHDETFAGTGERFSRMDLSGGTFTLENTDGLGVNNRRCYKNIPFYLSSRPYGLFLHTTSHVRLSLADISTRAAQGLVEEPVLDLFFVGGGSVERILYNYRCLTGFPPELPAWSYGIWMSRMTYLSEAETRTVAKRLRDGRFPCDVIHLDTGWFDKDWVCDWTFNRDRFPDPERYMRDMRKDGFRITLWQTPYQRKESPLFEDALAKGYIAMPKGTTGASDFAGEDILAPIDFSNPEAVAWYQEKIGRLLEMGAAAIKTDFGEDLYSGESFQGMPAEKLHNVYSLLYQKAAFEITKQVTGEGIIWARSGWAGAQRYPVHWGGDCACSWDGLAGSIRGGLHLGLSGFAYWSHDVPGFHGIHDFMDDWPDDDLYVRWTQAGTFTSHFRYHGAQPREPYEYPAVADIVRTWWNLRYALIPYLMDEAAKAIASGAPLLRALLYHHADDPMCWHIDDQFYCGDALMVAPVMNSAGVRDVYLPEGEWVDLWTGESLAGSQRLKNITMPLERIPVYARQDATIRVYPERVQCTDEMDLGKCVELHFDSQYSGIAETVLGNL